MLSDRRINPTHDALGNVMIIKWNHNNWLEAEKEKIIEHMLYQRGDAGKIIPVAAA